MWSSQSHASFNGIREGGWVKTEEDPLEVVEGTKAVNYLEDVVVKAGGAVLRYGGFYGAGADDEQLKFVRKRLVPIVGGGAGSHLVRPHRRRSERHGPGGRAASARRLQHRR